MATLEDFTIPILSFGELGCPMKCMEFSVLTLAPDRIFDKGISLWKSPPTVASVDI